MVGQGSPKASLTRFVSLSHAAAGVCLRFAPALLLAVLLSSTALGQSATRIRVSWGGGAERLWLGNIALSEGKLLNPRPIGIEADEPGSMWLDARATYLHPLPSEGEVDGRPPTVQAEHLVIWQRSPRTYDGLDLEVIAPATAKLYIELVAADDRERPGWVVIPIASLFEGVHNSVLDDRGNRLLVHRAVDDDLRVEVPRGRLVFWPGELFEFNLVPHLATAKAGDKVRIQVELTGGRQTQALWSNEFDVICGQAEPVNQRITLPEAEGVYDVVITARQPSGLRWPQTVTGGLKWKKEPLAQRRIQLLVLDRNPPAVSLSTGSEPGRIVDEMDPAHPGWWERFAKLPSVRRQGRLGKGPLGSGNAQPWQHPVLGQAVLMEPGGDPATVSWEAYSLAIDAPGKPHVLEVSYPSDMPQTMGISIVEPNPAGAVFPIGLDSGVELTKEVIGESAEPRWLRHRLVFWPQTKAPLVLITNRRRETPAVYGKMIVKLIGDHLPRAFAVEEPQPERLMAAYLDRPLFPENCSASQALGTLSDLGVDDWITFHQGGIRLVEYLNHVGFNGLMVAALADGSTIYPSRVIQPTPRYDTGVFLSAGQDPVRKDVLEMLHRLFDRQRLQLIPSLEFGAPLPELETLLRQGGPESQGIHWVGRQGRTWTQTYRPVRGMAPYYNVLHPRVQEAMLRVVRELVERYGSHPSFSGLAIQLSAHGYSQLPGPDWGMDDVTIARFANDTGRQVPGSGPERFAHRAAYLAAECPREWLQWRAEQLSRFYGRVRDELTAVRPGGRLYLAGASMLDGQELQNQLKPVLPRRLTMAEAMLRLGIDVRYYAQDDRIVLLRPERISPDLSLASQAVELEIRQMEDVDRCFQALPASGSLFFHKPQELRLSSFDEKGPFKPSYTWLATQAVPSGDQNRRRFVRSLAALDSQAIFDGGWLLSMGQEDSIRALVAAYRRLPAVRFQQANERDGAEGRQPVAVRYVSHGESTYIYAVNSAPFSTTAKIRIVCPAGCRMEELSGMRPAAPLSRDAAGTYWSIDLEPYDLVAVRLSAPDVKLSGVEVNWPDGIQTALERRIADLGDRAAALRNPPVLEVLSNPGFEQAPAADGQSPGWSAANQVGVSVALDLTNPRSGTRAMLMTSNGPPATLVSEPFNAPVTGRLTMSVSLRTADVGRQPPLQLSLVGKHQGNSFSRYVRVGLSPGANQAPPMLDASWRPFVVQVNDLPLEGLSKLQLRFDLMGAGKVWIDDVQLCELAFSQKERVELFKLIAPADLKLQKGEVGDCLRLLEGYWPRFLVANVPLVQMPVGEKPESTATSTSEAPKEPVRTTMWGRMRNILPEKLRF